MHRDEAPRGSAVLFVYAGDSGLFNSVAHFAHKLISPDTYACSLCKLSYGALTQKRAWTEFLRTMPVPVRFIYRDEFSRRFPERASTGTFPVAHLELEDGTLQPLLATEEISGCETLAELIALTRNRLERVGIFPL